MKKKLLLLFVGCLGLTAVKAQVPPDFGFEIPFPTGFTGTNPQGWASANALASPTNSIVTSDAVEFHTGGHSAKIVTKNTPGLFTTSGNLIPDISGVMLTGSVQVLPTTAIKTGYPFTTREDSLGFFEKYTPVGTDSGFVAVIMFKTNYWSTNSGRDTIGSGYVRFGNTSSFSLKYCKINYVVPAGVIPDTALIVVSSSDLATGQVGSTLWVDDFQWGVNTIGIANHQIENLMNVYPIPASNKFTMDFADLKDVNKVEVTDLSGRISETFIANNQLETYSTEKLSNGLYIYRVLNSKGAVLSKGKLNIVK